MKIKNRTLFICDNLPVLMGMDDESVDLIYLDPPFNSKRLYASLLTSKSKGASFSDVWTDSDIKEDWLGRVAIFSQPLFDQILAISDAQTGGKSEQKRKNSYKAYLTFMAIRLIEMRRILKPVGSIYLHCDPTMSHYLKIVMDTIFGGENFRSEIIWQKAQPKRASIKYASLHDVILFYSKDRSQLKFHSAIIPQRKANLALYKDEDARGKHRAVVLTAPGISGGDSGKPWRGIDPAKSGKGRHWAVPDNVVEMYKKETGVDLRKFSTQEALDRLDAADFILWPKKAGGIPNVKRYIGENPTAAAGDVWAYQSGTKGMLVDGSAIDEDVKWISANDNEDMHYPTQKPLGLLKRIIKASSDEGDVVLDPFCGCSTTCVAAEHLKRRWIGIDESMLAKDIILERFKKEKVALKSDKSADSWTRADDWVMAENELTVETEPPTRENVVPLASDFGEEADAPGRPKHDVVQAKILLFGLQSGKCNGCGNNFDLHVFHLDHIIPKAKGGADDMKNVQLLCGPCNVLKGTGTMEDLKNKIANRDKKLKQQVLDMSNKLFAG